MSPIYFVSKICPLEPCAGNLGIRFKFLERVNSPNGRRIPFGESERGKKGRMETPTDKESETKTIMDVGFKGCNWKQMDKAR